MGKIVFFIQNKRVNVSPIVYVSNYRRKGFLRRDKIEYSYFAPWVVEDEDVLAVKARISKDYPDVGEISVVDKLPDFKDQTFYVIREGNRGKECHFFSNFGRHKGPEYTRDIMEAEVMFSLSAAEETLSVLRLTKGVRVTAERVVLTAINMLAMPVFSITCTSRKSGVTKFYARAEGNRLRLVETSYAACHMDYESVMQTYESLHMTNRNFCYAVMPEFKDNVRARDLESYLMTHKVKRELVMSMKMKCM